MKVHVKKISDIDLENLCLTFTLHIRNRTNFEEYLKFTLKHVGMVQSDNTHPILYRNQNWALPLPKDNSIFITGISSAYHALTVFMSIVFPVLYQMESILFLDNTQHNLILIPKVKFNLKEMQNIHDFWPFS